MQHYDLSWAYGVAGRFIQSYPRGWQKTKDMWGLTDISAAHILAETPELWRQFKRLVKMLEKDDNVFDFMRKHPFLLDKITDEFNIVLAGINGMPE